MCAVKTVKIVTFLASAIEMSKMHKNHQFLSDFKSIEARNEE